MSIQLFPKELDLQSSAVADLLLAHNGEIGETWTRTSFDTSFWDWPVYLLQHYLILVGKAGYDPARLSAIAPKAIVSTCSTICPYK